MARLRLVIIGGVAAGTKAAARARRVNPNAEIVIYQQEAQVAYSACGEPYALSGVIEDYHQLIIRTAAEFVKSGVSVFTQHRVLAIDTVTRKLTIENLNDNHCFIDRYDALIFATGAMPYLPKLNGMDCINILSLRSWSSFLDFRQMIKHAKPRKVLIIGMGYIALELAETLTRLGIETTLIGRGSQVLTGFDADMVQSVTKHLEHHGVNLLFNQSVIEIITKDQLALGVKTTHHVCYADVIIFATGIKPNVSLAKQAGIKLGATGAIQVNAQMMTNISNIYAAGDCCESLHRITNKAVWQPLGDTANLQGRVAGENAVGGNAVFSGCLGTSILKAFDFNIAMTGLSEHAAVQHGFVPVSVTVNAANKARYYPNVKSSAFKLIADLDTGQLLGAQVVGLGESDKLIDIIATALLGKLKCEDLETADFAYSPPFSPVLSPVVLAASALNTKLKSLRH